MMDVPSTGLHCESETNASPLIMETTESLSTREHTIDMIGSGDASSSSSSRVRDPAGSNLSQLEEERPSDSTHTPAAQTSNSSLSSNSRNSSSIRRGDPSRRSSPLNSGLWICLELVLTMSQIIAAIVVLSLSRNEHPHAPLAAWVVGYASGCVATLPLFYWRYLHRNQASEQDSVQARQGSSQINVSTGPFSLSVSRMSDGEERQTALPSPRSNQGLDLLRARLKVLVEYFKMALDCFFAVWFVVGNVWIFGGNSSATEAPNLYRLCIMFLTFSCIGYAMPFILCITICCCLPCIISVLGFREDLTHTRGASTESIDALPTYKFKMKKGRSGNDIEANSAVGEGGGVVAVGTEKERVISREDAVCCICLAKYSNNEELRELPCTHFFHKECVDKWLKINALCPLCKSEVGESLLGSLHSTSASQQHV